MKYNIKEYKFVFDTPAKRQQERAIVVQIMKLLNENKYDNIDDFISMNPSYQDFLKKNNMENVVKHFGSTINELDFKSILESLKKLSKDKSEFNNDNIKTTNIDGKEYVSLKDGETIINLDNTSSNQSIESQMKELQPTQQEFQTSNKEKNTQNLFRELEESKKEGINLYALNQIDSSKLNEEETTNYNAAINYQISTGKIIKVDVEKGIIADEENNLLRIVNENGEIIIKGENSEQKTEEKNGELQKSSRQLVLKSNPNTLYSNVA